MVFFQHPKVMIAVGILSLPLYYSLAKLIWGKRFETLGETIRYLLIPDLYSLIRGEFWDDWYASIKWSFSGFSVSLGQPRSPSFWRDTCFEKPRLGKE